MKMTYVTALPSLLI